MQMQTLARISGHEFQRVLLKLCPSTTKVTESPPLIGIAVSGGSDSMSLVGLASQLQTQEPHRFRFHAFIVDHKARPGSTEEAETVRTWVENAGISATVHDVHWPQEAQVIKTKPFETTARRIRYRILGLECRRRQIKQLLLAHHSDDQAETVLGRIVAGHTSSGLAAMAPSAPIPECFGLVGAHNIPNHVYQRNYIMSAFRGVTIHRPLLDFSKAQLTQTCQDLGLTWIEDKTNFDPTFTTRNAVRYLLSHRLPLALTKVSLLSLQRSTAQKLKVVEEAAWKILKQIKFDAFDLRSGVLKIGIPVSYIRDHPDRQEFTDNSDFGEAMRKIAECVTPMEYLTRAQGLEIAKKMLQDPHLEPRFTLAGVFWQAEYANVRWDPAHVKWVLSRIPHYPNVMPLCVWSKDNSPLVAFQEDIHVQRSRYGTWQLYDKRFWIRLWSTIFPSLFVRPLAEQDMAQIRQDLGEYTFEKMILRRLRSAAPGDKIRYTVPVIAASSDGPVLALPSLDITPAKDQVHNLNWEIQYKHVDLFDMESPNRARGKVRRRIGDDTKPFLRRPIFTE